MLETKRRSYSPSWFFFGRNLARAGFLGFAGLFLCSQLSGCVERTPPEKKGPRHRQLTPADHKEIKKNILKEAPAELTHKLNAQLGDKAVYIGADVQGYVRKGVGFKVTHYWKVLKPMAGWRMFAHLNGPGGKSSFVNVDHAAIGGRYPVTKWKPGEIIRDVQDIVVPKDWSHKKLEIYTGIWRPKKGRLKVKGAKTDGHDRILVASLELGKRYGSAEKESSKTDGEESVLSQKRYVAKMVDSKIKIDGKGTEDAWKTAPFTDKFVLSVDGRRADESMDTEAKFLWNDKFLYVFFNCKDNDVWSTIDKRDGALWTQEAVRVMVDAGGEGKRYIDIQVNSQGTLADALYAGTKDARPEWDSKVEVKVSVDGTLNKRDDKDQGWSVEMAIPMESVLGGEKPDSGPGKVNIPPTKGDEWRVNLFRVDFPKGKSRIGLAWNPPKQDDLHLPDKFGVVVFGDEEGNIPKKEDGDAPKESSGEVESDLSEEKKVQTIKKAEPAESAQKPKLEQKEKKEAKKSLEGLKKRGSKRSGAGKLKGGEAGGAGLGGGLRPRPARPRATTPRPARPRATTTRPARPR